MCRLLDLLSDSQQVVRVFITADHGILWHNDQKVVSLGVNAHSARYVVGHVATDSTLMVHITDKIGKYTAVVGPYFITRSRRTNEWGFHGGVSARESLVPLFELEHRP